MSASRRPSGLRSFLELFVLCGFAVCQPVLDVMGRSPDFFLFQSADRTDIVLLAVVVVMLPPVVLWTVESAVGLVGGRGAARLTHLLLVAGLLGLVAIETLKDVTGLRGAPLAAVAALAAGALTVLYARLDAIRLWLRYLTPAPIVFVALFLGISPVSKLVVPSAGGAAALTATEARSPVVVLLFDELPVMSLLDGDGRVDERLYPSFARLAGDATWFRNTTTMFGTTANAVPSMLTGRYVDETRPAVASEYPENLFTLLGGSHELRVSETVTGLCPPDLCATASEGSADVVELLGDAADVLADVASPAESHDDVTQSLEEETVPSRRDAGPADPPGSDQPPTTNQPVRFETFVESFDGSGRPALHFLHLLLPHSPFRYLPSGFQYPFRDFGKAGEGRWSQQAWPVLQTRQRHLMQTVYADALLGQALDALEDTGLYDRSLVVVAADHGVSFLPGQFARRLTSENAHELLWVPFFVKRPGQDEGEVNDANVQTVDVVPTIADVLDVDVPWPVDGRSAFGDDRRTTDDKPYYFSPGQPTTVRGDDWLPKVLAGVTDGVGNPGRGPEGLYEIGPHRELLGTAVADHRRDGSVTAVGSLDDPGRFADVDPDRGSVPAQISGQLRVVEGGTGDLAVAVAVNGTIAGVSEIFEERAERRKFATMVSEQRFEQGANRVEVFVVTGRAGAPTLHPVALQ